MHVEVERIYSDGLYGLFFVFYVQTTNIGIIYCLHDYKECRRPTKRHKWAAENQYNRLRDSIYDLKRDDISVPEEVITEALGLIKSKIEYRTTG